MSLLSSLSRPGSPLCPLAYLADVGQAHNPRPKAARHGGGSEPPAAALLEGAGHWPAAAEGRQLAAKKAATPKLLRRLLQRCTAARRGLGHMLGMCRPRADRSRPRQLPGRPS